MRLRKLHWMSPSGIYPSKISPTTGIRDFKLYSLANTTAEQKELVGLGLRKTKEVVTPTEKEQEVREVLIPEGGEKVKGEAQSNFLTRDAHTLLKILNECDFY